MLFTGRKLVVLLFAAALAAAALVVSGCGSGGDSSSTVAAPAPAQSSASYVKQAESVCKKSRQELQKELQAYQEELDGKFPEGPEQEEFISDVVAPHLQNQAEQLRVLGPPKGKEAQAAALVKALEKLAKEGEADFQKINDTSNWKGVTEAAQQLGVQECGEIL